MKIAIEGCAHGELERIYDVIQKAEKENRIKVDLLLCCGDFQSTRNLDDLQTMAVPQKYQNICTFYKYYSGEKVAPIMTIFIGGNHEASNYLQELPYGGWVAPNIYYLGYAGVVRVNGIRIGGLSGIYKGHDFLKGHFEHSPYDESAKRSVYHVRQLEVFRLQQLSGQMDIFLSHDWPRGIYNFGNKEQLARFKPHFRNEMDNNELGNRPCEELLQQLRPSYWFAAHLHCKFAALVPHYEEHKKRRTAPKQTKFLALDKCLPKRRFMQIMDIEAPDSVNDEGILRFEYDLEWLAVLQLTNHLVNAKSTRSYMPGRVGNSTGERYDFTPKEEELEFVRRKFNYDLNIPNNFCRTVEPHNPKEPICNPKQPKAQINPQNTQFCDLLGIDDPLSLALLLGGHELNHSRTLDSDNTTADTSLLLSSGRSSLNTSSKSQNSSSLKRNSLGLPKPNNSTLSELSFDLDATSNVVDELNLEVLNVKKEATAEATKAETAAVQAETLNEQDTHQKAKPPMKKFKRRNANMYKEEPAIEQEA